METKPQLVLNTCPDAETARRIAAALVERNLAACVNIIPGVESVYRWQGKVETDSEHLLLIKCSRDAYPALEQAVTELHPYELPEIVAVPIEAGLPGFLDWINNNSKQP
jgi:periplasmic divalent cation tolerance protein